MTVVPFWVRFISLFGSWLSYPLSGFHFLLSWLIHRLVKIIIIYNVEDLLFITMRVCCGYETGFLLISGESRAFIEFEWSGDEENRREMEVRSENIQVRFDKFPAPVIPRTRLQVWFIRVCSSILLWTCLVQLVAVGELWHPKIFPNLSNRINWFNNAPRQVDLVIHSPPPLVAPS